MQAVELFCGAGGFSFGMKNAGINVLSAYDAWPAAISVYRRNMPLFGLAKTLHVPHYARLADIGDLLSLAPTIASLKPALIFGGPPCQDFSSAGERIEGTRADMTLAFAMVICTVRPEWFVMENVPPAAKSIAWGGARSLLAKAGYGITETELDASYYGVPQSRKRFIAVGRLNEIDNFLLSALEDARTERPMSVRDALGDEIGSRFYLHPRYSNKKGIHSVEGPSPTIRSASRRSLPQNYIPHEDDALPQKVRLLFSRPYKGGRGVRSIDEPFPTIIRTSRERAGASYLKEPHPDDLAPAAHVATITADQMSRIQGFPPAWDWTWTHRRGAPTEDRFNQRNRDQMIANAVPPPLAEAIGRVVRERMEGSIPRIEPEFSAWLVDSGIASGQVLRNKRSHLNKVRRLLGGRTFADVDLAIGRLEVAAGFEALSPGAKSDLRSALRLHHRWRQEVASAAEREAFGGMTEAEHTRRALEDAHRDEEESDGSGLARITSALRARLCPHNGVHGFGLI